MMTKRTPTENRMLQQVRRRREAYEADQSRTDEQRATRLRELAGRLGLPTIQPRGSQKPTRRQRHT